MLELQNARQICETEVSENEDFNLSILINEGEYQLKRIFSN